MSHCKVPQDKADEFWSLAQELVQDCYVTSGQMPAYGDHIKGYSGYQPRAATAAEWRPLCTLSAQ